MIALQLTIGEPKIGSQYRPRRWRLGPFTFYAFRGAWRPPVDIEGLQQELAACQARCQEPTP